MKIMQPAGYSLSAFNQRRHKDVHAKFGKVVDPNTLEVMKKWVYELEKSAREDEAEADRWDEIRRQAIAWYEIREAYDEVEDHRRYAEESRQHAQQLRRDFGITDDQLKPYFEADQGQQK